MKVTTMKNLTEKYRFGFDFRSCEFYYARKIRKMTMKKIFCILLSLAFCLCVAGCSTPATASPAETVTASIVNTAASETHTATPSSGTQTEPTEADASFAENTTDTKETEMGETMKTEEHQVAKTLKLYINGKEIPVKWQNNASVNALAELAANGLSVQMSMYGGFEQVGYLGKSLPRDDKQTTTDYGDIMLYSGNQIVIFYGSNSWAYTRLGHVDLSKKEITDLLSNGNVTLTLKYE